MFPNLNLPGLQLPDLPLAFPMGGMDIAFYVVATIMPASDFNFTPVSSILN